MSALNDLRRVSANNHRASPGTGQENHCCSQDDTPPVHHVSSTSTGASTVRSRSLAKSSALFASENVTAAPVSTQIKRQLNAARHIVPDHTDQRSATLPSRRCAMIRFSKAKGTRSSGFSDRAKLLNLFKSCVFISSTSVDERSTESVTTLSRLSHHDKTMKILICSAVSRRRSSRIVNHGESQPSTLQSDRRGGSICNPLSPRAEMAGPIRIRQSTGTCMELGPRE